MLIYVGEWKGNTATRAFEAKLLLDWTLELRMSLPVWGSEATLLMVWRRRNTKIVASQNNFWSCFMCTKEAVACCRVCKQRYYCSAECMHRDSEDHRRAHASCLAFIGDMNWETCTLQNHQN